jgi:hypothetical protein
MSNTFAPFGFAVAGRQDGAAWSANQTEYLIAYDNTNSIYTGDIVTLLGTGYIDTLTPGVVAPVGIFNGCEYISSSQGKLVFSPRFPGGDQITNGIVKAYVIDDPNTIFYAQTGWSAGTPAAATQAMVGANAQYANGTGSTLTGQSGAYIDLNTTPTTTSTFPFRILSLVSDPPGANGTDTTAAYNWVKVMWNFEFYRQLTGI